MSEEKTTVKLLYIGRRLCDDGSLAHAFQIAGTEKLAFWEKMTGHVIGMTYAGKWQGERACLPTAPVPTDDERAPQWEEWWAEDLADYQKYTKTKELARLAKKTPDAVNRAIDALVPIVRFLTQGQTTALVHHIVLEAKRKAAK